MARSTRSTRSNNPGPTPKTGISVRLDPDLLAYIDELGESRDPRQKRSVTIREVIAFYRTVMESSLSELMEAYKHIMPHRKKKRAKR